MQRHVAEAAGSCLGTAPRPGRTRAGWLLAWAAASLIAATAPQARAAGELRVLLTDSGELPLPGVTVKLRPRVSERHFGTALAAALSDDQGMARISLPAPAGAEPLALVVDTPLRLPVALDLGAAPAADSMYRLVLPSEALPWTRPLRVQVDGATTPLRVELRWAMQDDSDEGGLLGFASTRAEDGLAELARAPQIELLQRLSGLGMPFDVYVTLGGEIPGAPRAWVPEQADDEPLHLHLPPCGRLYVDVQDAHGAPLASGPSLSLWTRPLGARADVPWEQSEDPVRLVADGHALYAPIGLGLAVRLELSQPGAPTTALEDVGPGEPGEERRLLMRRGPLLPVLQARLLDEQGQPLADTRVRVEFRQALPADARGPVQWSNVFQQSDAHGFLRCALATPLPGEAGSEAVVYEASPPDVPPAAERGEGPVLRYARIALPGRLPDDGVAYDVGDLRLEPLPVLVAGEVARLEGNTSPYVPLRVDYALVEDGRACWYELPGAAPSSGREGRFTVRGLPFTPQLRVRAGPGWGHKYEPQLTSPGNVALRLEGRQEPILGRLPAEPTEPAPELGTLVGRVDGINTVDFHRAVNVRVGLSAGGEPIDLPCTPLGYSLRLPAGEAWVELRLVGSDQLLHRIDKVLVQPGRSTRAPHIDLQGKLATAPLRVLQPDGRPLRQAWVLLEADGLPALPVRTDPDGRCAAIVLPQTRTLALRVPGIGSACCALPRQMFTLQLEPEAPEVALH